jgi:hypothetical protein
MEVMQYRLLNDNGYIKLYKVNPGPHISGISILCKSNISVDVRMTSLEIIIDYYNNLTGDNIRTVKWWNYKTDKEFNK